MHNVLLPTHMTDQVHYLEATQSLFEQVAQRSLIRQLLHAAETKTRKQRNAFYNSKCCEIKARRFNCQRVCYTNVQDGQKKLNLWSLYTNALDVRLLPAATER